MKGQRFTLRFLNPQWGGEQTSQSMFLFGDVTIEHRDYDTFHVLAVVMTHQVFQFYAADLDQLRQLAAAINDAVARLGPSDQTTTPTERIDALLDGQR